MMRGKLLGGRYQILEVLANGGFGQTYIALDMHRPGTPECVVKHLQPASVNSGHLQNARRLFQTEAEILEQLGNHAQIPRLLAYFEENQEFYLVQEFIQGHTLSVELHPGRRWSENQVYQLLQEVLGILVFVHGRGVIHRDIKPDNIIRRSGDGKLVLVDFGSVKQAWTQVITTPLQSNSIPAHRQSATIAIGTPGYMPTEQGRGRPQQNSDIYALGMIAIQALTGVTPTQLHEESENGEIAWRHLVDVDEAIASVLTKMVRYNYKNRYQTATEALAALKQLELVGVGGTEGYEAENNSLATHHAPLTTHPTVFVPPKSHSNLPNSTATQTNLQPTHAVTSATQKPNRLKIGAAIAAMLIGAALYTIRLTPAANTEKTLAQNTTLKLAEAKQLATKENFPAAIALARQIPPTDGTYPAAKQLITQWSNRLKPSGTLSRGNPSGGKPMATTNYRSGKLSQASDRQAIGQTIPIDKKAQAIAQSQNHADQQATKSSQKASKHNAIAQAKHKQVEPIIPTSAKISAAKTDVVSLPLPPITRRLPTPIKPSPTLTSTHKNTLKRQTILPRQKSASTQPPTRTIPRKLPTSLTKPPVDVTLKRLPDWDDNRPDWIIDKKDKKVTRSIIKRNYQIVRQQTKYKVKIQRQIERSYRWSRKTLH